MILTQKIFSVFKFFASQTHFGNKLNAKTEIIDKTKTKEIHNGYYIDLHSSLLYAIHLIIYWCK